MNEDFNALTSEVAASLRQGSPTPGSTDTRPTLPAYTGAVARCIKCGARTASTAYRSGNQHADAIVRVEHLERQCTRCSYRWPEACADNVPPSQEGNAKPRPGVRTSKDTTHSNRTTPEGDKGDKGVS